MSLRLAIVGYVQKPTFGCASTFIQHIRDFPPKNDLLLLSYHDWPDTIKLLRDPETPALLDAKNKDGTQKRYALSNAVFLAGMRAARDRGYSHVIYVETDCRFGTTHWDVPMFEEFFNAGRPLIAAGTLVAYNVMHAGLSAAKRWQELTRKHGRNVPVGTYGWLSSDLKGPSCVFPNGALSVVDVAWMAKLFNDLQQTMIQAVEMSPYDMEIGKRLWDIFGEQTYEMLEYLECIYSGFGDALTTPEQRREMLKSGRICAMHQEKTDWVP